MGRAAAILSVASLALVACGEGNADSGAGGDTAAEENGSGEQTDEGNGGGSASGELIGGGASSQEAAMTAWTQSISDVQPDLTVSYDPVGSGSGREGFINGQYTFAGSDAAMDGDEQSQAEAVCGPDGVFHTPSYISPVAIAYNLPGVEEQINMDAATLGEVFAGEVTNWSDDAIAEHNEGVELPDQEITVVHRADDSGTTENFTDYLSQAAGEEAWGFGMFETWPDEITAESAQQTSGVVSLTSETEGAITYADASQVGDLGTVAVQVGEEYVPYSAEAAAAAVENSEPNEEAEGAVNLERDTTEAGSYPIVLVSYHIFCHSYQDQETADQVQAFGEYVLSEDGQQAAAESAGNAPISEGIRESAMERLSAVGVQE